MKKVVTALSVFALSFGVFANASFASDTTGTAEVTGGTLNLEVPASVTFDGIELDGTIQTTFADLGALKVVDPTGTGNGWNVSATALPLTRTTDGHSLPANSLVLSAPVEVTAEAGSSDATILTPDSGNLDSEFGVSVLDAKVGQGLGTFNTTFGANALTLTLSPDTAFAGQYETTITWNLTQGPKE
ncbi:WxL domain-containing protein [Evansella sp. AB-P1]|uniref:WxL domain-containing protein n=1 Tax=Evansella sp. AB-P1 TaxID=3037653 RepID=UPI00241C1888|nr:WxL domain-containing protein [Evansella sp. AB-P1]MDG5789623.1 WxL domain-containing protein [Evansella sp. AB-P1]